MDKQKKILELQQLAENIRLYCPDARQCDQCGWGPILLDNNCDNLIDHHMKKLPTGGIYDNSCRQCGACASTKSALPLWDGKLPQSLTVEEGLESVVITAAPAPKFNRLAELVKDLDLTVEDFEDAQFLEEIKALFAENDRYDVETVTVLRQLLTHFREQRSAALGSNTRPVCQRFIAGRCLHGDACRFSHNPFAGNRVRANIQTSVRSPHHPHPLEPIGPLRRRGATCDICQVVSLHYVLTLNMN